MMRLDLADSAWNRELLLTSCGMLGGLDLLLLFLVLRRPRNVNDFTISSMLRLEPAVDLRLSCETLVMPTSTSR
jgi:hypothetical protein